MSVYRHRKKNILNEANIKGYVENAGPGSRGTGYGVPGYGVRGPGVRGPGVWKTRCVENAGPGGKRGVPVFRQTMNFPQ